jgi:hypothetical protein
MEVCKVKHYDKDTNTTQEWFTVEGTESNGRFILAHFDTEQEANEYLQHQIQISKDLYAYMKQQIQNSVRTDLGLNF